MFKELVEWSARGFKQRNDFQRVHIYTDGSVLVTHGVNELGQVIHTKMLQVREIKFISLYIVDMTDIWH